MMTLLNNNLIESVKLHQNFMDIFSPLKSCLDDDWMNELRFAAILLTRKIMENIREDIDHDVFKELYEQLLKRLDDAQDGIRIETCKVFEIFFEKLPDPWSSSLYEYTINNIFVHLDDQNTAIQEAVSAVLRKAARVQTHDFIKYARAMAEKSAHPALCQSLCDYAQETYKQ